MKTVLQRIKIAVLSVCLMGISSLAHADWTVVGTEGFSATPVQYLRMAIDSASGTIYTAFADTANGSVLKVMKYADSTWSYMGTGGISIGAVSDVALAVDKNGGVDVAYIDAGDASMVHVQTWNGSGWVGLGANNGLVNDYWSTSIDLTTDDNAVPYIAFNEHDNTLGNILYVDKFDGSNWVRIGNRLTGGDANSISIAMKNNNPWVVYIDGANDSAASVIYYDGSSWNNFFAISPGVALSTSIKIDRAGNVYVGFADNSDGNYPYASVLRYDGNSWQYYGSQYISQDNCYGTKLGLDYAGNVYIAFTNIADGDYTSVYKYDGIEWMQVGSWMFASYPNEWGSLAFDKNSNRYVSVEDGSFGWGATVVSYPLYGDPSQFGNGVWNVYVWDYADFTNGYLGFYTDTNFNQVTANIWDPSTTPTSAPTFEGDQTFGDQYCYAAKRQGFPAGYYTLNIPEHDDDVFLYVNDSLVFTQTGCCQSDPNVWNGNLDSTSTIDFRIISYATPSDGELDLVPTAFTASASAPAINCAGGSTTVTVTAIGGKSPYTGTGTFSNVTAGTYNYTVYDTSGDSTVANITVSSPAPLVSPIITASGATAFCQGDSVTLQGPGVDGYGVSFTSDMQHVSIPYNTPQTNITYEMNFKATQEGNLFVVYSADFGGDYDRVLSIDWNGNLSNYVYNTGPTETITSSGYDYRDGQWHHVAVVIDSGVGTRMYADGALAASGVLDHSDFDWDNYITLGGWGYRGEIDNMRLWGVAKSQTEIQALMNTEVNTTPSGLLINLKFNEGTGSTTINSVDSSTCTLSAGTTWAANSFSGYSAYTWSNGATTHNITATTGDVYSVVVSNISGCTATSNDITVTVYTTPSISISSSGPTGFCGSNGITLYATPGTSYLWSTGDTTSSIYTDTTNAYYVTVTDSNGCSATSSGVGTVSYPIPVITSTTNGTVCGADTVNLSASANIGTIYWYADAAGDTLLANGNSFTTPNISSTTTYYINATAVCGSTMTAVTATVNALPVASISSSGPTGFCGSNGITLYSTPGTSYLWSTGDTTSSIYTDTTNAYTVTVTDANGCSATSSGVGTVSYPIPTITSTTNGTVCGTDTVNLSASASIGTIYWYADAAGDTLLATGNSFTTPSISSTTTYYVNATAVCGSTMTAVTATVNALPSVTANTTASSICSGGTVTLTGGGASGYTWDNSVTDGVPFGPSATHTYTVTGTDGNICSATATVAVTVTSIPSVASTLNGSICDHGQVILSGTPSSGYLAWYSDSSGNSLLENGDSLFTQDISSTTTYYVEAIDNGCISSITSVTATVNPLPSVTANTTASSICSGSTVTLTGSGASSYTWDGGVTDGLAFADTVTHTYTVTGTNGNGCSATATTTVNINAAPLAYNEITSGSNVGCGSVTLNSLGLNGIVSFLWNNGGTDKYNTVDTSGNYFVIVTDVNGCTATSITLSIIVNPNPSSVTVTAGGATTFCQGDSVTLTANSSAPSLEWSTGATTSSITVSANGSYTVTATNTYGCTAASSPTFVTVKSTPTITNFLGSSSCSPGAFEIGALASAGTTSWYADSTGGSSLGTGMIFYTPTISSTTTYYVEATNNGCTSTRTAVTATINNPPSITMGALSNIGSCNSSFALSDASPSGGIYSGTSVSNNHFSPSVGAGTYSITYTYTDINGCTNADSTSITVAAAPNVTFSTPTDEGICLTSVPLTGGSPSGGVYSGTAVTNEIFNPSVAGIGTYTLTYTFDDVYGCSASATNQISVTAPPFIISTTQGSRCDVGTVALAAAAGNDVINWYADSTGGSSLSTGGNFTTPSLSSTTTYYAEATRYGCPSPRVAVTATVSYPTASSANVSLCAGQSLIVGTYTFNTTGVHIATLTGANGCDSTVTINMTVNNPATNTQTLAFCAGGHVTVGSHTYTASGTYTDVLTAQNGCDSTVTTNLNVNPLPVVNAGTYSTVGICNSQVDLTNGGPSGGMYSGTGVSNNHFNPSISAGAHIITYSYTDANSCSNSDSTVINVAGLPLVSAGTYSAVGTCNNSFNLNDGSPAGGTYSGTGVANGKFNPAIGAGTYTILYSYTDTYGCTNSDSTSITVASNPLVTAGSYPSVGVCNGPVTLNNGSPSGGIYSGTGVSNGAFHPSVGAGTYTITYSYSNSHGCSATSQTSITVDPLPTVNAGTYSPIGICKNPFTLSKGTPSGGIYSGSGVTSNMFDPGIGAGNHWITYTYTDAHGCFGNGGTSIDVITAPTVSAAANYDICSALPPFALTGGMPAGGTYSGTGVSNGIFDPSTAGIGNADITYTYIDSNGCSGQASQIISVNVCTGIENNSPADAGFSIYPNPNKGVFTLKAPAGEVTYTILNEIGQVVRRGTLATENNYMVDIHDLSNGIYYVVGRNNQPTTRQKIIVAK